MRALAAREDLRCPDRVSHRSCARHRRGVGILTVNGLLAGRG